MRRVVVLLIVTAGLLAFGTAAGATNYPPTTTTQVLDSSTVAPQSVVSDPGSVASTSLPRTGSTNTVEIFWVALGLVGVGALAVLRTRRGAASR